MIVAAMVATRCALPTEVEAHKTACRTADDCLAPSTCIGGQCATGAPDAALAALADAAPSDATPRAACLADDCGPHARCDDGRCRPRCAAGCASDEVCHPTQDFCVLARVDSCPAAPCRGDQVCADGLCATVVPTSTTCEPGAAPDGCPPHAVCSIDRCLAYPACPPDDACPVGPVGGACSADVAPDKVLMCLPRVCRDARHCPPAWRCVPALGRRFCTDGAPGSPCGADSDCTSGRCLMLVGLCR